MDRRIKYVFLVGIVLILAIGLLTTGCTGGPSPEKPIKIRYSTHQLPTHHMAAEMMPFFKEEVEKRTGGKVIIELYLGGELYKHDAETIEAVTTGAIEMGNMSSSAWDDKNPAMGYGGYWFLHTDYNHWRRARAEARPVLDKILEEQNVKLIHNIGYGEGALASKVPITKPADIKGLKVRAPAESFAACVVPLGGTTAMLPATEVYDAVAKGAIDAVFSGWSAFWVRKWYEVTGNFIGPMVADPWTAVMNLSTWESLPKDIQQTLLEVGAEAEELSIDSSIAFDEKCKNDLRGAGGNVTVFTSAQAAEWAAVIAPAYDDWLKACDAAGAGDEVRKIKAALDATR